MTTSVDPTIDKATWGDGPWQTEPDRVEWDHAGLPCLALRNHHGTWCGYVAVPPGHRLHGKDYDDGAVQHVSVHGGLTYAAGCQHRDDGLAGICHVPKPGEPDNVWWFGFDCGHCFDFMPAMHARHRHRGYPFDSAPYDHAAAIASTTFGVSVYRTLAYVQGETNALADQLARDETEDRDDPDDLDESDDDDLDTGSEEDDDDPDEDPEAAGE